MICPHCIREMTLGIALIPIVAKKGRAAPFRITPIDIPVVSPISRFDEVMKCPKCGHSIRVNQENSDSDSENFSEDAETAKGKHYEGLHL